MQDRRRVEPKLEVLSEPAAARLLARASELDATLAAGATLTDLRTAAAEAGISSGAFDAALAEMRAAEHAPVPDVTPRPRPRRRWVLVAGAAALILAAATAVVQRTPADAAAAMVDEAILLRCLSTEQAAALVRPLLQLSANRIVISPHAPEVLTVRGTPAQITQVRRVLDESAGAGASCHSARSR